MAQSDTMTKTDTGATAAATLPSPGETKPKAKKNKVKKSALPRKVGYFILYVPDMAKAVEFYKGIGLKLGFESPEWTEFKAGIKFALHASSACAEKSPATTSKQTGLVFNVKKLDKAYEAFQSMGVKTVSQPTQVCEDGRSFEFEDPFGNVLSLYGK